MLPVVSSKVSTFLRALPLEHLASTSFAGVVLQGSRHDAIIQTERPVRRLGDAKAVGHLLGCSCQPCTGSLIGGKMPSGFKLGALRRWDLSEIEAFIAGGCKPPKGVRS